MPGTQTALHKSPIFEVRLRVAMKNRGLSNKDLADKLFINHSTVAQWLRGVSLPTCTRLVDLARVLYVSPNYLLGWAEDAGPVAKDEFRTLTPRQLAKWGDDNPAHVRPTGKRTYRKPCPCGRCGRSFPRHHPGRAAWENLCPYLTGAAK